MAHPRRKHTPSESPSRTYVVGLPVIITVRDDGRVFYMVDSAEAGSEVWENYPNDDNLDLTDEIVKADRERIDADHDARMALIAESD